MHHTLFINPFIRLYRIERWLTTGSALFLCLFLWSCQSENVKPAAPVSQADIPRWKELVEDARRAAQGKQWDDATRICSEALNLINDPQRTLQAPSESEIRSVMAFCDQTQLLAGNFSGGYSRSVANCDNMLRGMSRGIAVKQHLVPIQFDKNQTTISPVGQNTAKQLAVCLKEKGVTKFKVLGHTDMKGSDEVNDKVSLQRAEAVKKFLKKEGIQGEVIPEGRGKRTPLQIENPEDYSEEEIDAMNRRVEVVTE